MSPPAGRRREGGREPASRPPPLPWGPRFSSFLPARLRRELLGELRLRGSAAQRRHSVLPGPPAASGRVRPVPRGLTAGGSCHAAPRAWRRGRGAAQRSHLPPVSALSGGWKESWEQKISEQGCGVTEFVSVGASFPVTTSVLA